MSRDNIPETEKTHKHRWHVAATLTTLIWKPGAGQDRGILKDWTRMFEPNWKAIALDESFGKTALRILLLSATMLGADHAIQMTQKQMADALSLSPAAVHQAMQSLVAAGLILQHGHTYWLNSRLVAKGRPGEVARLRHDEVLWMKAVEEGWEEEEQG